MTTLAYVVAAIFGALGALHILWALGVRTGSGAVLPERDGVPLMTPGPFVTLVVAALLLTAGLLVLTRVGLGPARLSASLSTTGVWGVAVVMIARAVGDFRYVGFFKRVRGTRFAAWDTRVYSPLTLALGLACGAIAYAGA